MSASPSPSPSPSPSLVVPSSGSRPGARAVAALAGALLAAGCGGKAAKKAPPPGTPTTVETLCDGKNGSAVRVTGYFRYKRALSASWCETFSDEHTCEMSLYADPDTPPSGGIEGVLDTRPPMTFVSLYVPVGRQPGEMKEPPAKFDDGDILLHLAGGAKAGEGDRVTLDGILSSTQEPADPAVAGSAPRRHCWLTVTWAQAPS